MEVRTCKQCKRLFNYLSGPPICPGCKAKIEQKFQEVKRSEERRVGKECL